MLIRSLCAVLMIALMTSTTGAVASHAPAQPQLTPEQRDRLRFKLEVLYNEQDLLIRNQRSNQGSLDRMAKDFETLKVYERIPLREDWKGLKASLQASSADHGLKVLGVQKRPAPALVPNRLPARIYTDQIFKLKPEQVVAPIPFTVQVQGEISQVRAWVGSWAEDQMRLAEPEGEPLSPAIRHLGGHADRWEVRARAFRFLEVKYPSIQARDPVELLPAWARTLVRKDPEAFARQEPQLWSLIERTRAISPQARPFFRNREDLMVTGARMSFFVSKAVKRL